MGKHIITIGSITNSAFVIGGEVTIAGEDGDVVLSASAEDQDDED